MSVNEWLLPSNEFWKLEVLSDEVKSLLATGQGQHKNCFKLKPSKKNGKIVYFTVDFTGTDLPAVWKEARLFPRGDTPAPQPIPALPAQPTPQEQLDAVKDVKKHLKAHGTTTERLDGEIHLGDGSLVALTLIQVPGAIPDANASGGTKALLCLFTIVDVDQPANPDGTGGGSSGHN